ncbi:delta-lactam-biosynthetic de-N-acetylase [Clostridiales bacterium F-3ap]|uniref:Delta-lactam-biosynthetic de-N-acetylase n=1 Tax=Anaerotalea alkaliphila TaxID=2662126 RepID=A0A7X5HWQ5_9FIRM|nr:delta-lactam-biosynthetic de-N-acetylase [Anaerotalea alkaliphila]
MEEEAEPEPVSGEGVLSNEKVGWSFRRNPDHKPAAGNTPFDVGAYGAYGLEDTKEKVVYLTFDEGYEYGYTPKILDVLKDKGVKAAFFVTKPYIKANPDLVERMSKEGHVVGNHSATHPSFPGLTDGQLRKELEDTEAAFADVTGQRMDPFFRPPMGEYSQRVLELVRQEGYKTIFWSMAYKDWDVNSQPGAEVAYRHVMDNHHAGAIILLHAVSSSNTEALGEMIDGLRREGYRFKSLQELP